MAKVEIDRYLACGCWHESAYEGGVLEELQAHICEHHMVELRGYLDSLGLDKNPEGQYTLTFETQVDHKVPT